MAIGTKLLRVFSGLLLLAGVVGITPAHATMTYDYTLPSPGFFNGSGNSAEHFTADVNSAGVTAALGVVYRYSGPQVAPNGGNTNIYQVNTGDNTSHLGSLWGWEFSIAGMSPSSYVATITMTDVAKGVTGSFVLNDDSVIHDNSSYDGTSVLQGGTLPGATIIQNSETNSFTNIATAFGYGGSTLFDSMIDNTYRFKLDVVDANNHALLLASTNMVVNAGNGAPVPEPASFALLGAGLLGLGTIRVLKKKNSSSGATPA